MSNDHLYLNLIPESLVASNLPPKEFGSYMAVGTKFFSRGEAIFFKLRSGFDASVFVQEDRLGERVKPHSDGSPKRSLYLSSYRVLERVPLDALGALYLTTDDGRVLELERGDYQPEPDRKLHLYQEFCPATPAVASRLSPAEFAEAITDPTAPICFPRLVSADPILTKLANDPLGGEIGNLPYHELDHVRHCLASLSESDSKSTKNVSRRLYGRVNYRTMRRGFYVGDPAGLAFYPMPSREQLESVHYDWWRSAQAVSR